MERDVPTQLCLNRISDWMVLPIESGVSRPYRRVDDDNIVRVPLEKARCRQKLLIEFPAYRKLFHESPFLARSASVSSLVPRGKNKPLFKVNCSCFVGGGKKKGEGGRGSKKGFLSTLKWARSLAGGVGLGIPPHRFNASTGPEKMVCRT